MANESVLDKIKRNEGLDNGSMYHWFRTEDISEEVCQLLNLGIVSINNEGGLVCNTPTEIVTWRNSNSY